MASNRNHLIEAYEALIIINMVDNKRYIRETGFFGRAGSFQLINDFIGRDTVEIRRINTTTWENAEDITEECAREWLIDADANYAFDYDNLEQCESIMPEFVKRSKTWARWMDDQEAEKPVDPKREYGTHSVVNGHVE